MLATLLAVMPPPTEPRLHFLVGGFVLLVAGLALLTRRRPEHGSGAERGEVGRAAGYCLVYTASMTSFARLLVPALLNGDRSPWLLALGDVLFVTCGLFVWVLSLAERRSWSDFGFRGAPAGRMTLALLFGAAAAALFSAPNYAAIASGRVTVTADTLVFSFLLAAVGSALPEEMLFRGYLQGSLEHHNRWLRVGLPALAFTLLRALRYLPGPDMSPDRWLMYVLGTVFPLGVWWGLMRDHAKGSLWPSLLSNFMIEFGHALGAAPPVFPPQDFH